MRIATVHLTLGRDRNRSPLRFLLDRHKAWMFSYVSLGAAKMLMMVSAGAVLFREDGARKYLLLQRAYHHKAGYWDFPRGNEGEDPKNGKREEVGHQSNGVRSTELRIRN